MPPCDVPLLNVSFESLQETVQNAEDAGASEIFFTLDERKFASGSVFKDLGDGVEGLSMMQVRQYFPVTARSMMLLLLQGPALYVYNNAGFRKEDWDGITSPRLGSGKKKSPEKIGKFGLGFSSVYHVTGPTRRHS